MSLRAAALLVMALAAGCASEPGRRLQAVFSPSQGSGALQAGLRLYDDGDYAGAQKALARALDQGLYHHERASAHKHLAFIHCASGRERPCREEFRRALAADPALELTPAEAGHPAWGPAFRAVRGR